MSLRTFLLSLHLRVCLCSLLHFLCPDFTLLLVRASWVPLLFLFFFFLPSPFSLTFSSPLLGSVFLPANLCISQYLLNLCSLYRSFSLPVSLSAFPSPTTAATVDRDEETRSADVYPALCCHKLFTSVYHAKHWNSQDECGVAKIAKKNYISPKTLSRFGSDVVWFLSKWALWS